MLRLEEMQTPEGQTALHYYQLWMRSHQRAQPAAGAFLASRYFRTFIEFAAFVKAVSLPRIEKFIWLMKERDFPPTIWRNDDVYSEYLEFLDHKTTPTEQFKQSVSILLAYADKHEIDISGVFELLQAYEVIHMVRTRQVSPWFLLHSQAFKRFWADKTTPEQRIILETLIRPDFWYDKFKERASDVIIIKQWIKELNV